MKKLRQLEKPKNLNAIYHFIQRLSIKLLTVFILETGEVNGFILLKTVVIYFEKFCINNKNLKQTNTTKFL